MLWLSRWYHKFLAWCRKELVSIGTFSSLLNSDLPLEFSLQMATVAGLVASQSRNKAELLLKMVAVFL